MQAKLYTSLFIFAAYIVGSHAAPIQGENEQQSAALVHTEKRAQPQNVNFDLNSYLFTVGAGAIFTGEQMANDALKGVQLGAH